MKNFRSLLLAALSGLMLISVHTKADDTLEKIQKITLKPEILCGQFNQQKTLVGLKSALNSNGRFCVHREKGIVWRTLKPFPNILRVTENEITQWQGDKVTMRMDAKREPVIQMINNVLFSLMAGDFSQLEKIFQINAKIRANEWQVDLKVRDSGLRHAIEEISLNGGAYVRNISIHEANGDKTQIVFSDIQTDNATKDLDEISFYE